MLSIGGCRGFCSSDPWWQCDFAWLRAWVSHLLGQICKSQHQEMGHLQHPYGGGLLGRSLVDSVPQIWCRHKSRNADQHLAVPLVSALLSGNQKELQMEFGCFGRTPGYSALLWILLSRKQLKKWCFTERCPPLLLTWWICQIVFLYLERLSMLEKHCAAIGWSQA